MDEIKINMIEKTDEGLVLKLPTTSVEQVKGLKEKLSEKVDKVEDKQLSTNDYSTEDKNKLAELENYDDTNIKADIAKKVNKVSGKGLSTNDYTDLEKAEVAKIKKLATSETVAGIKSEVETLKTSKVDKIVGKGLSTNDYNNTEKAEVSKIKNKADITDLDLKIDKTSITSDLEGIDENKVLSQKAGNKLFTSVNDGKGYIANAIIDLDKNVNVSNESTFTELGDAITNNLKAKPIFYGFEIDENNSNPKTAVTYINENVGFTPAKVVNGKINWGSWEQFVKYISYRVVVKDGIEQYKVQYDNPTKKLDGSSAILTGADGDLFTKFIPIWRKYTKTAKGYKIELSDEPFTGAKSLVNELENGYNQFNNPIMILLQDLYLLIFKDRDSQTALGRGHVSYGSKYSNTGGTNGKGYIYGETTGKLQMCFLGIEDLWGNKYQWVDGLVTDGSYNILTGTKSFNDSGSGYTKITTGISSNLAGYAKTVQGGDAGYILADEAGSTSTGYCDSGFLDSGKVAHFGGYRSQYSEVGAFCVMLSNSAYRSDSNIGARLCFKNTEGVYVGNYLGYVEASKLRSIVGKEPTGDKTIGEFRTYAKNNN